jgi:PKD repeat protein
MIRRSRLAAVASLLGLAGIGCDQPVGPRPVLIQAEAAASSPALVFSASRADFDAQFPNLPVESFEAGNVADADVVGCPGPLDATSNNTCFSPGGILPGIRFNSDHTSGLDETGQDVALLGNGFGGIPHSKQLVATFTVDGFVIEFTENVTAAGMDLVSYAEDNCQVDVFGLNDVLLGSTTAPCTKAGTFWGVSSATPIARIRIYSPTHQFEGVDNVAFGAGVQQVPPVAQAGGPYAGIEGEPVHFDGSASSDPGGATLTYQWDFGDGTPIVADATPDHTYAHAGTYTVTLTVSNGTLTATVSTTATIAQAPAPIARAGGPYSGTEGSAVHFDGTASSDPRGATLTYQWNFGDGSAIADGATPSHTYADNGSYTVTLTVSNGRLTGTATATATIANVVPSLGAITGPSLDPVQAGTQVTAGASFTDPGTLDTHTGVFDWGDGTTSSAVVTEANGSGSASGDHAYAAAGVYSVTLTVTDKDGGSAQAVFQWVVVFDPAAGFVTGGGWINSPIGAYAPNPSLAGKATFGFVSRYQQGASTPSGNTEFQFHAASLAFHSTSYDWLVVAGSKVQFKGSGTINGAGDYGFMLTAVDGALKGGDPDTFRMRIWDKATGVVIYDNQLGSGNGAAASTALGGGSIVIHQ